MRLLWGLAILTILIGCEGKGDVRSLSDYELSQRYDICREKVPTAPGKMQACDNIQRECERRKRELGLYLCTGH